MEIPALNLLQKVFVLEQAQQGLAVLYADSQKECTRNGKKGMEIGMSREKDMCALLKLFLGAKICLDIDNDLTEDFTIVAELLRKFRMEGSHTDEMSSVPKPGTPVRKVSIKHITGALGTPVKIKWTSADKSVEDTLAEIIAAPDDYYPDLLLVYFTSNSISIRCITAEQNSLAIRNLGRAAFKVPSGNSRGIEYSSTAMSLLMKNTYFEVNMTNVDLTTGIDPIERRMKKLISVIGQPQQLL